MEETLGVQLFERSRAGTLLSSEGRELLPLARDILDKYQHLVDTAQGSSREMGGSFKIGVSPTVGPYFPATGFTGFASALPDTAAAPERGRPKKN